MFINRHISGQLFRCRLFGLAIFVYTAAASLAIANHGPDHKRGGRGGEDGGGRYDVEVLGTGTLSSNGTIFLGFGGGSRFKTVSTVGTVVLAGLDIFSGEFGYDQFGFDRGKNCFDPDRNDADVPVPDLQTVLAIYQAKDGSALVQYVFTGFADDGTTEVGYTLEMYGTFAGIWRPEGLTPTRVEFDTFDTWEMFINGTGGVRDIACTGTGSALSLAAEGEEPPIVTVTERQS